MFPWQVRPPLQQSSVLPHPFDWPQPASPKSAHVFATQATHLLFVHTWPSWQGEQLFWVPQPRAIEAHPVTMPAS
jgi:hypothetical protein